jgi:putative flippase GtrA
MSVMTMIGKRRMSRILQSEKALTFIKFGTVGASGVLVNNGILLLLVTLGLSDIAASIIATECAIISNFLGNMFWTWRDHGRDDWQRKFAKFQLISIFTGALTVALFWAFKNLLGMPLLFANTLAIFVTFIINFTLNRKFTWKVER